MLIGQSKNFNYCDSPILKLVPAVRDPRSRYNAHRLKVRNKHNPLLSCTTNAATTTSRKTHRASLINSIKKLGVLRIKLHPCFRFRPELP